MGAQKHVSTSSHNLLSAFTSSDLFTRHPCPLRSRRPLRTVRDTVLRDLVKIGTQARRRARTEIVRTETCATLFSRHVCVPSLILRLPTRSPPYHIRSGCVYTVHAAVNLYLRGASVCRREREIPGAPESRDPYRDSTHSRYSPPMRIVRARTTSASVRPTVLTVCTKCWARPASEAEPRSSRMTNCSTSGCADSHARISAARLVYCASSAGSVPRSTALPGESRAEAPPGVLPMTLAPGIPCRCKI